MSNTKSTELDKKFELKNQRDFTHQVIAHLVMDFIVGCIVATLLIMAVLSLFSHI